MPVLPTRVRMLGLCAVTALGLTVSTAKAGVQDPGLTIQWTIDGSIAGTLEPVGTQNPNGTWAYSGVNIDLASGVTLTFSLTGDPDPLVSGGLSVNNPLLDVVSIVLVITLPIAPPLAGSIVQGSAAAGLTTDGLGGTLGIVPGLPVWQGLIDGSPVAGTALLTPSFPLVNAGFGSNPGASGSFGPIGGPAATTSIGIKIAFSLTKFDQGSMTSGFAVLIPGPGGLAVLGIGLLGVRRRRR